MDIGAVLLILALLILVSVFISRPFFEFRPDISAFEADETEQKRSRLLAEYDQALNSIRELEFDHSLGKIPEDEFPQQRSRLLQDAAEMLSQLDTLRASFPEAAMEDRIEAAISTRRTKSGADAAAPGAASKQSLLTKEDEDIEMMIAVRKGERQAKASGFCPHCGKPVHKSDKFCPKCGASLVMYEKG